MFTKDISSTYEENLKNEWLLTNGLGGYAASTLIGVNTRKYHGLLVAALGNEAERFLTLSKINESIQIKDKRYSISTNECYGYVEKGYVYQEVFEKRLLPEFLYNVNGVQIMKKIAMVHGENKVAVRYNIANTMNDDVMLNLAPLVNFRGYHSVENAEEYEQKLEDNTLKIDFPDSKYNLFIRVNESEYYEYKHTFYKNMYYRVENQRGFSDSENLYMPGEFSIVIDANSQKEIYVVAEVAEDCSIEDKKIPSLIRSEEVRLEKVCKIAGAKTDIENKIAMAADQFIISKNGAKTIIAGYPWFNDWGRDTFIALEGLTLKTNRFSDAKEILRYFSRYIINGLVPNYIGDNGGQAYNTVDASLWYIEALNKYIDYTNDLQTLREIYPKVLEIILSYKIGTLFEIKMDKDGLITAGSKNTQLTWMDAKVGDYIPTPRFGKAVEINALWYNALKITENFYNILRNNNVEEAEFMQDEKCFIQSNKDLLKEVFDGTLAKKAKESFKKFYTDDGLMDIIDPFNEQVRPNQIIALSLSYPVVSGDKAKEVLLCVKENLLTEKGLKTLSANDKDYKGRYEGNSLTRDLAYHQGTIWPWLIGEYAKAHKNVYRTSFVLEKKDKLWQDGCIGSIAEIYDADEPRFANGAFAQAWSVSAMTFLK